MAATNASMPPPLPILARLSALLARDPISRHIRAWRLATEELWPAGCCVMWNNRSHQSTEAGSDATEDDDIARSMTAYLSEEQTASSLEAVGRFAGLSARDGFTTCFRMTADPMAFKSSSRCST